MKKKYCYIIRYTCRGALSGRAIVSARNAKEAYQKFMKDWDGADWVNFAPNWTSNTGTVTSVAATIAGNAATVTGSPMTTSGTLHLLA